MESTQSGNATPQHLYASQMPQPAQLGSSPSTQQPQDAHTAEFDGEERRTPVQKAVMELIGTLGTNLTVYPTPPEDDPATTKSRVQRQDSQLVPMQYKNPFLSFKTIATFFSALVLIWSFAWLYIGATWDPVAKLTNLKVAVLNCDQGSTQALVSVMPTNLQSYTSRYITQPLATQLLAGSIFNPNSPVYTALLWQNFTCTQGCSQNPAVEAACQQELMDSVSDGIYWAGLFFSSNTTLMHLSDFNLTSSPNASVLVGPANQQVYVNTIISRGRNYSTYSYILLVIARVITGISTAFGQMLASSSLASSGSLWLPALVTPLQMNLVDLHPVYYFGQNMACYVLCLLAWLGGAFSVSLSYQFKMPAEIMALNASSPDKMPPMIIILRAMLIKALCCMAFTLLLSVLLVCVVLALGEGTQVFDHSPAYAIAFVWYLSWSYIAINAVLLHAMGIERFNTISAFLLVLQLMSSGGILSLEVSPRFFYIGKGLPFYYGVRTLRTVFFGGEENLLYINWLVVTAYNVVFAPLAVWFVSRQALTAGERMRQKGINPMGTVGEECMGSAGA